MRWDASDERDGALPEDCQGGARRRRRHGHGRRRGCRQGGERPRREGGSAESAHVSPARHANFGVSGLEPISS